MMTKIDIFEYGAIDMSEFCKISSPKNHAYVYQKSWLKKMICHNSVITDWDEKMRRPFISDQLLLKIYDTIQVIW